MKLEIKDLSVCAHKKNILYDVTATFETGNVYALMGPNGSGKSTLAQTIIGHPKYTVSSGSILLNGQEITALSPELRARKGLFLSFQQPVEIPGVTLTHFLRASYNATHEKQLSVIEFYTLLQEKMKRLHIDQKFASRALHVGFSGGEKKKIEILQMHILNPSVVILDETDSGLDVDALKMVAKGINAFKSPDKTIIIITHYYKMLEYITPNYVYIMENGTITKHGDKQLAQDIEQRGFQQ